MPDWKELIEELRATGSTHDQLRRKYLAKLYDFTGRNIIVYYSSWLQKKDLRGQMSGFDVNDEDKNGFMSAIHGLDKTRGLDIFLHTPGGEISAAESLVDYLRSIFGNNIRAIVPQLAMSAGTMIACSCKEILMGKHSSLGPIDPQINGIPTHGIIEEFNRAAQEISIKPYLIPLWQPIIAKYNPTLIGECEKAMNWASEIVKDWLVSGMFENDPDAETKANGIISELADHALTKSHARHISMERAKQIGLNISALEDDQNLQEAVLSVHHACILTLEQTNTIKLIQNQNGVEFLKQFIALNQPMAIMPQ